MEMVPSSLGLHPMRARMAYCRLTRPRHRLLLTTMQQTGISQAYQALPTQIAKMLA